MSHLFIGSFSILSIYRNDTNLPFIFLSDVLNEEDVNNSLIMIQPTLTSYTFDNPSFSTVSSQRTTLFLLDPYLYPMASLLPSEGRRAGYESFKALLELVLPVADAQVLLSHHLSSCLLPSTPCFLKFSNIPFPFSTSSSTALPCYAI